MKISDSVCALFICLLSVTCLFPVISHAAKNPVAGEIVNQNKVTNVRKAGTNESLPAAANMSLFSGDAVITGPKGWAAVLLSDETLVQVNRNTIFELKEVAPSAGWFNQAGTSSKGSGASGGRSLFKLNKGEAWFRNKNKNMLINIETPTVTAGIRGTEINITVSPDQTVSIAVLEGSVSAENPYGKLIGKAGELITTRPGEPPVKTLLLEPRDVVQWTVSIPSDLSTCLQSEAGIDPALAQMIRLRQMVQAQELLENHLKTHENDAAALSWLALVLLYRGEGANAVEAAEKAVRLSPQGASSRIVLSYCYQGMFDLEQAAAVLEGVLEKNPDNVLAMTNLARILFGSNQIDAARRLIKQAWKKAPDNADVLTLKGFLALADHDYDGVEPSLLRAKALAPQNAEPLMGLAIYHMRQGKSDVALKEIASAVLLEPRRSVLASYWGKMLYQIQRFNRALELLDLAETLDPNDPTPHLYKSIILRDLNHSGQAISELNQAVELNDNRAVYRSRFLLDQDLAVKNVNLSIIHNQLGLSEWARSKALESVKDDYRNASAHTYLAGALLNMEGRLRAGSGENILGLLLQPANINSLNTFQEYTSFFEQPDVTTIMTGSAGNFDTISSSLLFLGTMPENNLACNVMGDMTSTDGWRGTNDYDYKALTGSFKWDPSSKDSLLLVASAINSEQHDRYTRQYEYDAASMPDDWNTNQSRYIRAGYHRKISQDTDFLFLTKYLHYKPEYSTESYYWLQDLDVICNIFSEEKSRIDDFTVQGQVLHTAKQHELITGVFYEEFKQSSDLSELWDYYFFIEDAYYYIYSDEFPTTGDKTDRFYALYVQDIWNLSSSVTLESGLYLDRIETGSVDGLSEIDDTMLNPRLGIIYRFSKNDRIRVAGFRYVVPHATERMDPFDVAGVPVYRNTYVGAQTKEADLIWEHEWKKVYSSTTLYYFESELESILSTGLTYTDDAKVKGLEQVFNVLAGDFTGISASYRLMNIENETAEQKNRIDHRAVVSLTCNHPSGVFGALSETFRRQDMKNHSVYDDETIWITDVSAGYNLPNKRGSITLAVNNLFDQHFNWIVDDFIFTGRVPEREILMTLSLIF